MKSKIPRNFFCLCIRALSRVERQVCCLILLFFFTHGANVLGATLDELEKQAAVGSIAAMSELGQIYLDGKNRVLVDYDKALHWLNKAVQGQDPAAQRRLGDMYDQGLGVKQDYKKAFDLYLKSAEQGHAQGQRALGVMYELGKGVAKDPAKAAYLYEKAADQGLARAQANLGILYETGTGVEQDYEKAVFWYKKSTEKEYPRGQTLLGRMFERGLGVKRDLAKAAFWYRKAASHGYEKAIDSLRNLEKNNLAGEVGKGKQKINKADKVQAKEEEEEARPTSSMPGKPVFPLAEKRIEEKKQEPLSETYLQIYFEIGEKYLRGEGIKQDPGRAVYWLQQAVEKGNKAAEVLLSEAQALKKKEYATPENRAGFEEQQLKPPEDKEAAKQFFYLGNEYARKERHEMAAVAFQKAILLDPGNANTKGNLAVVLAKMGGLNQGLEMMKEVIQKMPYDASKYINLGIMLHEVKRFDEAITAYQQALQRNPTLGNIYHLMALAFSEKRNYALAWQAVLMAEGLGVDGSELIKKIEKEVPVPAYCEDNEKGGFFLRQIVTESEDKSEEIRRRLLEGKDFTELSASHSLQQFKEKGGYIGLFTDEELSPKIKSIISRTAFFSYSPVINTDEGYHIFQKIPVCWELLDMK